MFAVLLKVVPNLDQLRFDPERKTVIREGNQLFANPFDQRALRVALDLRRPGERVTVLSMGPPAAEATLREALALGADRAILLTDRALAGSDTLVTSRVLARALSRVDHRVVMAGNWSTDSETGQVAPEVAGLLGVPVVSGARKISRDSEGPGFEVTVDTEDGWAELRLSAPFVVSVGEKIAKLQRPTPANLAALPPERVERWTLSDLSLSPEAVGLAGSPTVVESIQDVAPARAPLVLDAGTPEERAERAARRLAELLAAPRPGPAPVPPRSGPLGDSEEFLVLVSDSDGSLAPATLPVVTTVRRSVSPLWPTAVWVGPRPPDPAREALADAGALRLLWVDAGAPVSSRLAALAVEGVLGAVPRSSAMAFMSGPFGREVAGQVAARQGLGLTGDAVDLRRGPDGGVRWMKPAFGGGIIAEIRSKTRPSLGTVRPGALEPGRAPDPAPLEAEEVRVSLPASDVERRAVGREREARWGDLGKARVIVCVGMGLGGPDRLPEVASLLSATGASLAATRRVVDAGWVPRQLQVGLTGRSLAPDLAVLLGVSGSVNHLIGWKRARTLLAVNVDARAPVFRGVDVGIVGRWEELVGPLSSRLSSAIPPTAPPPSGQY